MEYQIQLTRLDILQNFRFRFLALYLLLFPEPGGIGKSTAMKYLALSWADEGLRSKFDFVFYISLKRVRDARPIEDIIISQHSGLEANRVIPCEITSILENNKVLLLINGHDEYKTGINSDIDKALVKRSLWNCHIILTSRETAEIKNLKEYMDAEAEIR